MASIDGGGPDGLLSRILLAPLRLALGLGLGLAGVLLLAWIVGLVWVANVWPDRVAGLQALLAEELATGSAIVIRQGGDPATLAAAANLRASILTRFLPLLVLFQLVGMAEGLSHRAVRRSRAARESANLYHRAKYGQAVLYLLGGVGLLVWPAPLPWTQCAGCLAAAVAALAAGQWSFYKRHI
jgi:hypothetical protein